PEPEDIRQTCGKVQKNSTPYSSPFHSEIDRLGRRHVMDKTLLLRRNCTIFVYKTQNSARRIFFLLCRQSCENCRTHARNSITNSFPFPNKRLLSHMVLIFVCCPACFFPLSIF